MKKFLPVIVVLCCLSAGTAYSQSSCYQNPSFEGPQLPHQVPGPWQSCYGSPDTQPGNWGITQAPSNGNSYVSFLHSGWSSNGYNEGMTQLLSPCLQAGVTYSFTIDLAHTLIYNTASPNGCYSSMAVYGGTNACGQQETLWMSGAFTHTNWQQYTVTFTPTGNWCYLSFSPYFINACGGGSGYINVMMDNISCVSPVMGAVSTTDASCNGVCDGTAAAHPTSGIPPYTYLWTPGNFTTDSISGLCAGNYTVTITDSAQQSATYNFTINEPPALTVQAGFNNPSCFGGSDGTAGAIASGGTPPYSYNWQPSNQNTASATGLTAGQHTVTVTDSNGCTATATVTLVDPPPVSVSAPDTSICLGQTVTIVATATGGTGAYSYSWNNGQATTQSFTLNNLMNDSVVVIQAFDANGCPSVPDTVFIHVGQPLSVVASQDVTICPGQSATISAAGGGGNGNLTYTWLPINQQGQQQTVSPAVTTTYYVAVTDNCGTPPAVDSVTVNIANPPNIAIQATPRSGCSPLCVSFTDLTTVIGGGTIVAWQWDLGNGMVSNLQNPTTCYTGVGTYDVRLIVTTNLGCMDTLVFNNYITVHPFPVACFTSDPNPTTINNPTVTFLSCSTADEPATYEWAFGVNNSTSTGSMTTFTYPYPGEFGVGLIVTNAYGCKDTVFGEVVVTADFTFYVPNTFTPNDDGINDVFRPYGTYVRDYEMYIFDRWGEKLFYTKKLDIGWDGKLNTNGQVAKQDVYTYKINVVSDLGQEYTYTGQVQLVK